MHTAAARTAVEHHALLFSARQRPYTCQAANAHADHRPCRSPARTHCLQSHPCRCWRTAAAIPLLRLCLERGRQLFLKLCLSESSTAPPRASHTSWQSKNFLTTTKRLLHKCSRMNTVLSHLSLSSYKNNIGFSAPARETPFTSTPPFRHTKNNWLQCMWMRNSVSLHPALPLY